MVYASESLALASLELLVHVALDELPGDLIAIPVDIPTAVRIEVVDITRLPAGWRGHPAPAALAELGSEWVRLARTAVLSVPSAVVPMERNFLFNPTHPDFRYVRVGRPGPFTLDERLLRKR